MKILYGLSATGNGHVSRAQAILPELSKYAEVDVLSSGPGYGLKLKHPVKFKKEGFTFVFDEKGKIKPFTTVLESSVRTYIKDLWNLDLSEYDLVVTDLEPITAWKARLTKTPCIGFSNQYSYFSKEFRNKIGVNFLYGAIMHFASSRDANLAINYEKTEPWFFTPIIREDIRNLKPTKGKHITVYLVGYEKDFILEQLLKVPEVEWHFFNEKIEKDEKIENVWLRKVHKKKFAESLGSSAGFVTGAGFSATAEALYLGKKMLVIPLNHFEQKHNAKLLASMGVTTLKKLDKDFPKAVREWLKNGKTVKKDYSNVIPEIVEDIIEYAKRNPKN